MKTKYTVKLKTIVEEHDLKPLHLAKNYETAVVTTADINRPAMQLTGFYNYFDPKRIQMIGRVESTYLDTLSREQRLAAYERFMAYDICALVICHGVKPSRECMEMAEKYDRNLFITDEDTSEFQANVISSLRNHLAPPVRVMTTMGSQYWPIIAGSTIMPTDTKKMAPNRSFTGLTRRSMCSASMVSARMEPMMKAPKAAEKPVLAARTSSVSSFISFFAQRSRSGIR